MSFEDLPDNWVDRPVDDPALVADVLDLLVSDADRQRGGLALLICDDERRLVQPVVIGDLDPRASDAERRHAVGVFVGAMAGRGSLLLALARPDGLSITADDRAWATAARAACGNSVRFLGLHVVTLGGSREVPSDKRAA